jgi:hypothetical protein
MRVGGTRCMSLRDGAMRRDTFEIHAALAGLEQERADGEPRSDCRVGARGRSSSFHVIRIAWISSFASRFSAVQVETNKAEMPRAKIAGIAFERQASRNRRRMEMRSWWRCRSRCSDIGRQTQTQTQTCNQSIND